MVPKGFAAMNIVQHPDQILATPAVSVTDFAEIPEFAMELRKAMKEHNGVGIAANQVGDNRAVCIVKDITMVNPKIVSFDGEIQTVIEGCLSVGASQERYARPAFTKVQVVYQTAIGKKAIRDFTGWEARIVQHELRHLNGLTIKDKDK